MQQQRRVGIDAQTAHLEQVGLGASSGRSERGRHAITVADIAAAAEIAPRTARLYFRSKQDIAVSRFIESMDRLTAQLHDREPHDTAMEILGRWLRTEGQDDETNRFEHRMFASNRELRASHMTATLDAAVKALAEELGAAPDDIGPRIATALAYLGAGCRLSKARDVMPGQHSRGAKHTGCPAPRPLRHSCPSANGHGIRDRSRRETSLLRTHRGGVQLVQPGERIVRPVPAVHDVDE